MSTTDSGRILLTESQSMELLQLPKDMRFLSSEMSSMVNQWGKFSTRMENKIDRMDTKMDTHFEIHAAMIPTKDDARCYAKEETAKLKTELLEARKASQANIEMNKSANNTKIRVAVIGVVGAALVAAVTAIAAGCGYIF